MINQSLVTSLINANYSINHGVVINFRSEKVRTPICLCVSNYRNKDKLVPTNCIVWRKDSKLYEGPIKSKRLWNKLKKFNLCCVEVTSAKDMEYGYGDFICMSDAQCCKCANCACKSLEYYEDVRKRHPELNNDVVTLSNNKVRKLVTQAFSDGMKQTCHNLRAGRGKLVKRFR